MTDERSHPGETGSRLPIPGELREPWERYQSLWARGVKKAANAELAAFLAGMRDAGGEARRAFARAVCRAHRFDDPSAFEYPLFRFGVRREALEALPEHVPTGVWREIVLPVLLEDLELRRWPGVRWLHQARRWYGPPTLVLSGSEILRTALEVSPEDGIAWELLLAERLAVVDHCTHHLPEGLICDLDVCLDALGEAAAILRARPEVSRPLAEGYASLRALVSDWAEFQAAGGGDFAAWCAARGKDHPWTRTYHWRE